MLPGLISRSTFFRYFPSKEAVLTVEGENTAERVLAALREQPDEQAPWTALRHAMIPAVEHYGSDSEKRLRLLRLISATPVLSVHQMQGLAAAGRLIQRG